MKKTIVKIIIAISLVSMVAAGCHRTAVTQTQKSNGSISYQGAQGKTVLELLKQQFSGKVETKSFPSGDFVQSINGVTPDQDHYWGFFVNGKQGTVSAGSYVTQDSDRVEWKLMEINKNL